MFAAGGAALARPKKDDDRARTRHVRINDDLAEKLSWVLKVLGKDWTSARLLDPHIRGPILALYAQHEETIKAIQRAQSRAKKTQGESGE